MQTWTNLARLPTSADGGGQELKLPDGSNWISLGSRRQEKVNEPGSIEAIHLLAIGDAPQAPTKVPARNPDEPIRIFQTQLSQHAFAQQRPLVGDASSSLQDRVNFWMHEPISGTTAQSDASEGDNGRKGTLRMCRYLQNYYGFLTTPPRFLPWS